MKCFFFHLFLGFNNQNFFGKNNNKKFCDPHYKLSNESELYTGFFWEKINHQSSI